MFNGQLPNTLGVFLVLEIFAAPFGYEGASALMNRQWVRTIVAYAICVPLALGGLAVLGIPVLGHDLTTPVSVFLLKWLLPVTSNPYAWLALLLMAAFWLRMKPTATKPRQHAQVPPSGLLMPVPKMRTAEEWTAAGIALEQIINQKFEYRELILDGKHFINCTFTHVNMFYDGTLPSDFSHCQFDDDTVRHLHTHSPGIAQWMEIARSVGLLKPGANFAITPLEAAQNPTHHIAVADAGIEMLVTHSDKNAKDVDFVQFTTRGRASAKSPNTGRKPRALRFTKPVVQTVREPDLPAEVPVGKGQLIVKRFTEHGFAFEERGTVDDEVVAEVYFNGNSN